MPDLPESLATKPNIRPRDQTVEQLIAERDYWKAKIDNATDWGAAVGAASEFMEDCARELKRRKSS